jgi:hypothetical protein
MKPRRAYAFNKQSARQRGIPFEISFEEWLAWWQRELGPDWQLLRGRARYQFHMARIGDHGPYKLGNIKCITNSENIKEAWKGQRMRIAMASPERAAKISAFFKGRTFSPEHRAKLSAALKGKPRIFSAEHLAKLRSPEYRAKLSAAMMGNKNARGRRNAPAYPRDGRGRFTGSSSNTTQPK